MHDSINKSDKIEIKEKDKEILNQNFHSEYDNNNNANNNEPHLPLIREKRIFIHKPSDFTKNKYTFLGNLSNNKDLLNKDATRSFYNHKFNMKDFKEKMKHGNKVLKSIINDEGKILPNLLKDSKINKLSIENFDAINYNNSKNNSYRNNVYENNTKIFNKSNNYTINYNNKSNIMNINQKSPEKLIYLNFSISSPIRKTYYNKNNYNYNKLNESFVRIKNSNLKQNNFIQKNYRSSYYSMDGISRFNDTNIFHY